MLNRLRVNGFRPRPPTAGEVAASLLGVRMAPGQFGGLGITWRDRVRDAQAPFTRARRLQSGARSFGALGGEILPDVDLPDWAERDFFQGIKFTNLPLVPDWPGYSRARLEQVKIGLSRAPADSRLAMLAEAFNVDIEKLVRDLTEHNIYAGRPNDQFVLEYAHALSYLGARIDRYIREEQALFDRLRAEFGAKLAERQKRIEAEEAAAERRKPVVLPGPLPFAPLVIDVARLPTAMAKARAEAAAAAKEVAKEEAATRKNVGIIVGAAAAGVVGLTLLIVLLRR